MYKRYIKRVIDVLLSGVGLLVLAVPMAVVALVIRIETPGPVIFEQMRVGKDKKMFRLYKFRSMKLKSPDIPTHLLTEPELYITKVGKFIRRTSIDELPQLWNIFKGDMSFVGPRPAMWNLDELIAERDKYGANGVKPGLSGWAQVNGRDELSIAQKAKLDGEYVKKLSFCFDVKCFLLTVRSVVKGDGIVEGGGAANTEKNGRN